MITAGITELLKDLIDDGYDIGLDEYPIFDESYRTILNKKIIDNYYYSEINYETRDIFKHYLNSTMNNIMPLYNKLYEIEREDINPRYGYYSEEDVISDTDRNKQSTGTQDTENNTVKDVDETGTNNNTLTKTQDTNTTASSSDSTFFSDTPDSTLVDDTCNGDYATTYEKRESAGNTTDELNGTDTNTGSYNKDMTDTTSSVTNTDTTDSEDEYINRVDHIIKKGYNENLGKFFSDYLEGFKNIDLMIIDELADCFLNFKYIYEVV